MNFFAVRAKLPSLNNSLPAILSAILLILSFPGFEFWFLAWFALVPLFYAIEREKESAIKSFVLGWIFGTAFFFGSCWWLTFSLITYAAIPAPAAYFLLLLVCLIVGLFPAVFAAIFSLILKRFGIIGIFAAPFLWTAMEFLRFWATGNNWNEIAYSQAFNDGMIKYASIGGIYLVGFLTIFTGIWIWFIFYSSYYFWGKFLKQFIRNILKLKKNESPDLIEINEPAFFESQKFGQIRRFIIIALCFLPLILNFGIGFLTSKRYSPSNPVETTGTRIIAIQPNVPMSGLKIEDLERLRQRHVHLAENALQTIQRTMNNEQRTVVIFPESPMNFQFSRDREFQQFLKNFTAKNNVSVLFNAAEPSLNDGLYNSAVLVNEGGAKAAQYDKIHLVPFGEYVPLPDTLAQFVPAMVGSFEIGKSYNLLPLTGDVNAGIMICFESHFPTLSREFAREGADVLIELTNDGYLGNTPVLRQHLANAVFRAVETNRPLVRVTNVGITAFIDENGRISDATEPYTEDTRIWTVKKSDAPATFYVKYGDWFAWFCAIVSFILLVFSFRKRKNG